MKTISTFVLLFLALNVFAQTERKTWLVGGGINGSFNTADYHFVPSGINLQQGYFIKKNLLLGLHLSSDFYGQKQYIIRSDSAYLAHGKNYMNLNFSPFLRYYFGKSDWKFYTQIQMGGMYKTFRETENNNASVVKSSSRLYATAALGVGISYFPYKNWGVDLGIDYRVYDKFPDLTYWSSPVAIRLGLKSVLSSKR